MRRRLFTILSALSLLLCVATLVLRLRTESSALTFTSQGPATASKIELHAGTLVVKFIRRHPPPPAPTPDSNGQLPLDCSLGDGPNVRTLLDQVRFDPTWLRLGFGHFHDARLDSAMTVQSFCMWSLPLWAFAGLFSLPPLAYCYDALRRRRSPGLCPSCGYDLRATPDRCPECGLTPPPHKAQVPK